MIDTNEILMKLAEFDHPDPLGFIARQKVLNNPSNPNGLPPEVLQELVDAGAEADNDFVAAAIDQDNFMDEDNPSVALAKLRYGDEAGETEESQRFIEAIDNGREYEATQVQSSLDNQVDAEGFEASLPEVQLQVQEDLDAEMKKSEASIKSSRKELRETIKDFLYG